MHNCEEFRERITEYIIDREDLGGRTELQYELMACSGCSEFYAESREMMDALSAIDLSISERQWSAIQQRLNARIFNDSVRSVPVAPVPFTIRTANRIRTLISTALPAAIPAALSAVALFVVTMGLSNLSGPVAVQQQAPQAPAEAVYVERNVPLDPVTVDFLQESELLLRNVLKMDVKDMNNLEDARKTASQQLAELQQRKAAAAEVPPVVNVMDTYETILRDLRNVDDRTADEDITDIQRRIQNNGLIANMKAFQPMVTPVNFGQ